MNNQIYYGPKGGKYRDPAHKQTYKENKLHTIDAGQKKLSRGIIQEKDGTFTALTFSQSKNFKTKKSAEKWLAERGINPDGTSIKKSLDLQKAVWSNAHMNDLPDSAFLYIESGGKKDESGKTVPRSLRHFPYRGMDGKIDLAHVRNAIARIPQSKCGLSEQQKVALQNKARKYLGGKEMEKAMFHIDLEKAGQVYYGPKGGKYRDPQHKQAYKEGSDKKQASGKEWPTINHPDVDFNEVDELRFHAEETQSLHRQRKAFEKNVVTKISQGKYNSEQANKLWMYFADRVAKDYQKEHGGTFDKQTRQAFAHQLAREFEKKVKNNPNDYKEHVPKKYQDKWGKSLNEETEILETFLKSTIEDNSLPVIGKGKEQGDQSLDGKGKSSGIPGNGGATPDRGVAKPPVKKLSEDDEVDEKNMKDHKKPIENTARKSLRIASQTHEYIARDVALRKAQLLKEDLVYIGPDEPIQKSVENKTMTSDEMAVRSIEDESFYKAHLMNRPLPGVPLSTITKCIHCGNTFSKAITVCPNCGRM